MLILILCIFFYLGAIFWSFSTVLIERWHSGKGWIFLGRSECPKCNTVLWTKDLFPIFSYFFYRGKCAHCREPISSFYPISELLMGIIFVLLGLAGMQLGLEFRSIEFILLLIFWFITGVYILYDLRYMEIPDQIMVPWILILLWIPVFSILFIGYSTYFTHALPLYFWDRIYAAWILYTFFYIQILIPGSIALFRKKDFKNIGNLIIGYISFPFMIIIDFLRKKKWEDEEIDIPSWIWWGDLRIAIFIGLTLGTIHGIFAFFMAYITWSIVGIVMLIYWLLRGRKIQSQIPFWPFLWLWWIISIVFFEEIYNYIDILFTISQ